MSKGRVSAYAQEVRKVYKETDIEIKIAQTKENIECKNTSLEY